MDKKNKNVSKPHSRKEESIQQRAASLLNEDTAFAVVEAYKTARTNIIFALGASTKGCKRIIVTSANPGEGKTTTTLNLAIAFAQMDAKVLVIDGDLRKPRVYRHLQLERKGGLSDILCDLIDVKDAIHHCADYGIDCITSGQIPPNPAELLASDAMGELLDKLSEMYDYIFIDTPPVTIVTEATVMAKFVHGVVVVARQNYTIHESLIKARENLVFANAKILGYILNDITTPRYGYGKYYHNYGSYSYEYGYSDNRNNKYGYYYGKSPEIGSSDSADKNAPMQEDKKMPILVRLKNKIMSKMR